MTEYVLPTHANALGNVFGGQILAWMDIGAAICAQRHCSTIAVTAGIDNLAFEQPIQVGHVVRIDAWVTATFRTSIEVAVIVYGENPISTEEWVCVRAFLSFVAVDDAGHPVAVPALVLETEEERQQEQEAHERRAYRLHQRQHNRHRLTSSQRS